MRFYFLFLSLNCAAPSSAPENITVSGVTSRSFSVQWLPPLPEDRNGEIRSYSIMLTDKTKGVLMPYSLGGNETSTSFQDLHPAYTYSVTVAAVTIEEGPFSDALSVMMDEDSKQTVALK